MNIGRIILALLVALSVGMLPASSIAGLSVQSPEAAGTSLTQDMPDCCPPKADPCAKGHGRLRSDGDLRAQVLQLRVASASHRGSFDLLCEDDFFIRREIYSRRSRAVRPLPTSSGLTSP
jgi:hypothetical protein